MDSRLALQDRDTRVYYCPHCRRPVSAHKDALSDDWLFTSRGFDSGFFFKLPHLVESGASGMGALGFGAMFAYYAALPLYRRIDIRMPPALRGSLISMTLTGIPVALGVAAVAGIGRALVPGLLELSTQLFFGTSETLFGMTTDAKRKLAASARATADPKSK